MYLAVCQGLGDVWLSECPDIESARDVIKIWRDTLRKKFPNYNFCFVIYKSEVSETSYSFPT